MTGQWLQDVDVLVALKIAAVGGAAPTVRALATDLDVPKSTVAISYRRLLAQGLLKEDADGRRINRLALRELIQHGVRWLVPAEVGRFELGLPTAHAFPVLADQMMGDPEPVVIPVPEGPVRGRAVSPLHPAAPQAANRDPKLHELLALVDAFRIGRARDRLLAAEVLREKL